MFDWQKIEEDSVDNEEGGEDYRITRSVLLQYYSPRSLNSFSLVNYYIKWVKTTWADIII